jgi:hypothetical protein
MKTQRKLVILAAMLAFLAVLPVARASEQDQATKLTFDRAIQIPGRVLPAGTYWFVLEETTASPSVVHIFNSDRSSVLASVLTINAERSNPTDDTAITFASRGSMQPENLVTWFYPGRTSGHQFVYSNAEEAELAQVKQYTVTSSESKHQPQTTAAAGN